MKYILTLAALLFISCFEGTNKKGQREFIPDPEKYAQDGYSEKPDALKPKFKPDTSIGQISLLNSENVETVLGEPIMDRLESKEVPSLSVVSSNSKQLLSMYFHPGSESQEFSEFEVSYLKQKGRNDIVTDQLEFKTESGIKLGMTMGALRAIKGEPEEVFNNETTVFYYRIDEIENSAFLKKYNRQVYYAAYTFTDGYLMAYKFGFERP